ncbi:MAG: Biotin synthase [Chlamydiales bacterium]|nr:Biotin synthase [Chlamydiales bacterium]
MEKNWSLQEVSAVYHTSLFNLLSKAHAVHCKHHTVGEIQVCYMNNFKTGGCTEDCKYCSQSVRYQTHVTPLPLMQKQELLKQSREAIQNGVTRVCMGAAWREIRDGKAFDTILEIVKELTESGVEVCCTLGMLNQAQAERLQQAGLYAYNHNLDTSQEFYNKVISTRLYSDRLSTLKKVKKAGISVCCGGIIGLGESANDRIALLHTLSTLKPESLPINFLQPIKGTPLENKKPPSIWEMVRMIATARIVLPHAMIRLTAGRESCSYEQQALCFFAGANSLFSGGQHLTTSTFSFDDDNALFELFGLKKAEPFKTKRNPHAECQKQAS